MREVKFREAALNDLQGLEDYLAGRFYPENAAKFVQRIRNACLKLSLAPHQGTLRPALGGAVRSTGFEGKVTIFFEVEPDMVVILGIYYGGQQSRTIP